MCLREWDESSLTGKHGWIANVVHVALMNDDRGAWICILGELAGPAGYDGDKSDFPGFDYHAASLGDIVHESLPDIVGLILWNLVLALNGLYVFMRADVRWCRQTADACAQWCCS